MVLEYVRSKRGERRLVHEGFIYYRAYGDEEKVVYRCSESRKPDVKCRGRAFVNGNDIKIREHTCAIREGAVEAARIVHFRAAEKVTLTARTESFQISRGVKEPDQRKLPPALRAGGDIATKLEEEQI